MILKHAIFPPTSFVSGIMLLLAFLCTGPKKSAKHCTCQDFTLEILLLKNGIFGSIY